MRKTVIFGLCGLAAVSAAAAMAQTGGTGAAKSEADRQICRTFREVGTRLGGYRACHTAAEWAELRRQMRENVDRIQTRQALNSPGG